MPIIYKNGDLFSEKFDLLINPINCMAISGKGLALEFKKRFLTNQNILRQCVQKKKLDPGKVYLIYDIETKQWIANITTKDQWKNPSKLEWIYSGLQSLRNTIEMINEDSLNGNIGMSYIGCGLGGLPKDKVKGYIEKYLGDLTNNITIFEPRI